ncbi:MAG: HIT family protein [bacterium]|nr:HIT family protein [bacterium]MDD7616561.1 HIT family protein [bacterium]
MKFDANCIFCKIVAGQVPCTKLYEDEDVLAFLDINPVTYGHTLVISKEHYSTFLSTPKAIMNKVMNVAQRIGQVQIEQLGAKGVNILINSYEAAGQVVPHFHVHVIPRYTAKDGFRLEFKELKDVNLPKVAEEIKDNL